MKGRINKLISIYEIIGGVLGLIITMFMLIFSAMSVKEINAPILILIVIVLYILSLVAGICLLKKKQKGIILSIVVQIFQIPYIVTSSFTYIFIAGLQLGGNVAFLSKMSKITAMIYLGINFIPILIIGYFIRIKNQEISKDDDMQIKNNII